MIIRVDIPEGWGATNSSSSLGISGGVATKELRCVFSMFSTTLDDIEALEAILGCWAGLEPILGGLGPLLGASWGGLVGSWGVLGALLERSWGQLGGTQIDDVRWCQLENRNVRFYKEFPSENAIFIFPHPCV